LRGYWDIRGLGQPGRLLLEYAGLSYVDQRYKVGPPPECSRDAWLKVKQNLGLDFPNLPYLIDGDVKISHSNACYRYLGRKAGLLGKTEKEQALCDLSAEVVKDFRDELVQIFYGFGIPSDQYEAKKKEYVTNKLPVSLKNFSQFLKDKTWLAGETLTFPDFHLYELLDQVQILFPGNLEKYPNLVEYNKRFQSLPKISEYLQSSRFQARPINQPFAHLT